jgi:hypothetical protein
MGTLELQNTQKGVVLVHHVRVSLHGMGKYQTDTIALEMLESQY